MFTDSVLARAQRVVRLGGHLHSGDALEDLLSDELGTREIEDLAVRFQCVAAQIETATARWFDRGAVVDAVMASCAVPGLLPAREIDGAHYVDGGLVHSIPVSRALDLGATTLYVLQVGRIEHALRAPRWPWEVGLVAFEIARRYRFNEELARIPDGIEVHVLPSGAEQSPSLSLATGAPGSSPTASRWPTRPPSATCPGPVCGEATVTVWVPPRLLRRLGHVLWLPGAVVLTAVLLPFYLVGALAALFTRRMRLLRVVSFAMAYVWTDVGMVLGCWLLWAAQPLPSRDETLWREQHAALLSRALTILSAASHSMLGYRVALDVCPVPTSDAPLLVLSRHAGPGDSFSMVQLLLTTFRRRPKVVLKAALQWDPGIDLLLNRLDCYFLPSTSGPGGQGRGGARPRPLAGAPGGAAHLPGGRQLDAQAARTRRPVAAAARAAGTGRRGREMEHVLPPRPGGVVATLSARPDLDVVVMAHTGLDLLVSPWDIWAALPIDHQPMTVHWW